MRNYATCYSCGKKVEYTPCDERGAMPDDARCNVLRGWLIVIQWQGIGHAKEYYFCSFDCLSRWVEEQVPQIPKTFLDAFTNEQ